LPLPLAPAGGSGQQNRHDRQTDPEPAPQLLSSTFLSSSSLPG